MDNKVVRRWLPVVLAAWTAAVPQPQQRIKKLPQVNQDKVPVQKVQRTRTDSIVRQWEPGPPQPHQRLRSVPKVSPAAAVDVSTPTSANFENILGAWAQPDSLPQTNRKLPQVNAVVAVVQDQPPFARHLEFLGSWQPADPLPQTNRKLPQDGAVVVVAAQDQPPLNRHLEIILGSWQPATTSFFTPVKLAPLIVAVAAQNDDPPFTQRQVQDWAHFYPPPPLPTLTDKIPQSQVAATSDNPPFTQRQTQDWAHFYPPYLPWPQPTLSVKLTQDAPPPPPVPTGRQKDGDPDYWNLPWFNVEGESFSDKLRAKIIEALEAIFADTKVARSAPSAAKAVREYAKISNALLSGDDAAKLGKIARELKRAASQKNDELVLQKAREARTLILEQMAQRDEEEALIALGIL